MTPVAPLGLMVGKMISYGVLAFGELCAILLVVRAVFQVSVHGNVFLLFLLSVPFLMTVLGWDWRAQRAQGRRPRHSSCRWARFCRQSFSPATSS